MNVSIVEGDNGFVIEAFQEEGGSKVYVAQSLDDLTSAVSGLYSSRAEEDEE